MIPLPLYSSGITAGKLMITSNWFNAGIIVMKKKKFLNRYCGCFAQRKLLFDVMFYILSIIK